MWILQFLPDSLILWFTNILLLVGIVLTVAGFFVHRIPGLYQYQLPFKIAGIAVLAAGIYFRGGYGVEMAWRERVAELEEKIRVAEEQSRQANTEIQEKIVYKDKVIREKGQDIVRYVDKYTTKEILKEVEGPERVRVEQVIKYIENCPVPTDLVDMHNRAIVDLKAASQSKKTTEDKK